MRSQTVTSGRKFIAGICRRGHSKGSNQLEIPSVGADQELTESPKQSWVDPRAIPISTSRLNPDVETWSRTRVIG